MTTKTILYVEDDELNRKIVRDPVNEQTIEGNFLSFCGHTFCLALMGIFLNCSHDFMRMSAVDST